MRRAREARGWSQGRLAAELDLAVITVSSWERGLQAPEPPTFVLLAAALHLQPGELLDTSSDRWTLTELRVVRGIHQQTAAVSAGIGPSRLSQIEAGYERLREPLRSRLAALYQVTDHVIDQAWEQGRKRFMTET